MPLATGVGSMPGEDAAEATRVVLGEVPELPHLPELPARSESASMIGRASALLVDLAVDLQPAGWRLTDRPGVDQRRASSLLAQDLDVLEEQAQGYTGRLKTQIAGPWTLAASVERPRGDKVLADHGARRDLAQSMAEGLVGHLRDVRRRVPDTDLVLQIDEPVLPAVLEARVPTASGFGRHRSVEVPEAVEALQTYVDAAHAEQVTVVVHCCGSGVPLEVVRRSGAQAVSVDAGLIADAEIDQYAAAAEDGVALWLGVVAAVEPAVESGTPPTAGALADRVRRLTDRMGVDAERSGERTVLTPTCGLAGAGPAWARQALRLARETALRLSAEQGRMGS